MVLPVVVVGGVVAVVVVVAVVAAVAVVGVVGVVGVVAVAVAGAIDVFFCCCCCSCCCCFAFCNHLTTHLFYLLLHGIYEGLCIWQQKPWYLQRFFDSA